MRFSSEVIRAEWQETASSWKIWVRQTSADGQVQEFTDECEVLLHATGVLNNFKWPDIRGFEKFKGKMIHTARWPKDYQHEAWKGEKVAVIGSGASSIQTVPTMQPHAAHMDVFVRTPIWFVNIAGDTGDNRSYTLEQQKGFHEDPESLVQHAKNLEDVVNAGRMSFIKGSDMQKELKQYYTERTAGIIKDPVLLEKMIPKWSVGCRRITPGDAYMRAIQEPNVQVHFTEVVEITETGLKGKNGVEVMTDTIVCATGFDTSFRPAFPILGRNGVDLAEKWKETPEAYLGLAVPDMPNFFTFIGPAWPIGNGSVMGPLQAVGDYVIQFLKKFQVSPTSQVVALTLLSGIETNDQYHDSSGRKDRGL
jgi:cation diffusion facilitator CzcD-associated flavoprotein CzcO